MGMGIRKSNGRREYEHNTLHTKKLLKIKIKKMPIAMLGLHSISLNIHTAEKQQPRGLTVIKEVTA